MQRKLIRKFERQEKEARRIYISLVEDIENQWKVKLHPNHKNHFVQKMMNIEYRNSHDMDKLTSELKKCTKDLVLEMKDLID